MAREQPLTEGDFRRYVCDLLSKDGCHLSQIESHMTSAGIPDINFCKGGRDVWVELKIVKDARVTMRPTQKKWHNERHRSGGVSWVLVLNPDTQHILWLRGHVAAGLEPRRRCWDDAAGPQNTLPLSSIQVFFNHITYGDF